MNPDKNFLKNISHDDTKKENVKNEIYVTKEFGKGSQGQLSKDSFPYVTESGIEYSDFLVRKEYNYADNAQKSVSHYELAKKTGLKLNTNSKLGGNVGMNIYKLDADKKSVIMSPLNINGWIALPNQCNFSEDAEKHRKSKIDISIKQWQDLVEDTIREASSALEKGIYVEADAYVFMVREIENKPEVDFIIGDYDTVVEADDENVEYLKAVGFSKKRHNSLDCAKTALLDFLEEYVLEEKKETFEKYLVDSFQLITDKKDTK